MSQCLRSSIPATPEEQLLLLRLVARAAGEATELTETLRAVLHAVCSATGWRVGRAWLPRPDSAALACRAAWYAAGLDLEPLQRAAARRLIRRGQGLPGRAWSSGTLQAGRAGGSDRPRAGWATADGLTATVAIPVWGGDEVVAVLEFLGRPTADSGGRLHGLLLVIAAQVGALLQRIRLEQELRRAEAERATLLAAEQERSRQLRELAELKADFTAMVAHELGGPLAAIRGLAEALATGALDPEEQAGTLATIQAEARLLTALVADVQLAATAERDDFAVRLQPVRVAALLAEAAAFGHSLPGDHPLTLAADACDARVHADAERIGQVLRNLVGNAAKHSPPGTAVELRARREGGHVRIEVADRGFGIRPEDLQHIFEKFGRGHDAHRRRVAGAGLGLYLSRRILRAHGSELAVTSTLGAGASFSFTLEVAP